MVFEIYKVLFKKCVADDSLTNMWKSWHAPVVALMAVVKSRMRAPKQIQNEGRVLPKHKRLSMRIVWHENPTKVLLLGSSTALSLAASHLAMPRENCCTQLITMYQKWKLRGRSGDNAWFKPKGSDNAFNLPSRICRTKERHLNISGEKPSEMDRHMISVYDLYQYSNFGPVFWGYIWTGSVIFLFYGLRHLFLFSLHSSQQCYRWRTC